MREMPPPYSGHQDVADAHCLFRLDEAAGTSVDERGGLSLGISGVIAAVPGLVTSPDPSVRGAKEFTSGLMSRAPSASDTTAFLSSSLTLMGWVQPSSFPAKATIAACSGDGSSSALNSLLTLRFAGTELEWFTESGFGVDESDITSGLGLVANEAHHVAFVRAPPASGTAARCDTWLYVDGVEVASKADAVLPTGGSSARMSIGGVFGLSEDFAGTIDDVVAYTFSANAAAVRAAYARGLRDWHIDDVITASPALFTRTLIRVGSEWVDVSTLLGLDYGESAEWSFHVDDQVKTATTTLLRERNGISIAPFVDSAASAVSDPIVKLERQIVLEQAIMPAGSTPLDAVPFFEPVFEGFLVGHNVAGRMVELELADKGAELQNAWIEPDRSSSPPTDFEYGTAGGTAVEGELQQFIDDQEPAGGWRQGPIALVTPASPGWNVFQWATPSDKSVMGELERDADQIGWRCRYLWDGTRQTDRLTLYEPDRAKTWQSGDADFAASVVRVWRVFKRDSMAIRNAIEVAWGDPSTPDAPGEWSRNLTLVTDAASITEYGRRYARIGLPSSTELNDLVQVTRLANNMLLDLKQPASDIEIEVPFHPFLEVEDMVRLQPDFQRIDVATDFAIVGIRHSVSGQSRSTSLTLRAKVTGRRAGWFKFIQAEGVVETEGLAPPRIPANAVLTATTNGFLARWDWLGGRLNRRFDAVEVHVGATSGFTLDASTLAAGALVRGIGAITLNLPPGVTKFVRLRSRDEQRNVSAATSSFSVTPRYMFAIPVVAAHRGSVVQSVAIATATEVNYNVEDLDPASVFASSRFTMPANGQVHVSAIAHVDFLGKTGQEARLLVYNVKSGAVLLRRGPKDNSGATDIANVHIAADISASIGDVLTVYIFASEACELVGAAAAVDAETWVNWRLANQT